IHTITTWVGRRSSDKVIALVGSEDEQSIGLVNPFAFEVGKKCLKGSVVILKLLHVGRFARTERALEGEAVSLLIVVSVGDVGKDHRNAFLQHRLDHRKRLRRDGIET